MRRLVYVGGGFAADGVLQPTVLTGIRPEMEVSATEIFGPVVGVQAYEEFSAT